MIFIAMLVLVTLATCSTAEVPAYATQPSVFSELHVGAHTTASIRGLPDASENEGEETAEVSYCKAPILLSSFEHGPNYSS